MPNIINEVKLDFKDVLLRPKRSTLRSRNDVDLYREITFRNSGQTYKGVPVMASNMDTVGTFEMARELSKHGLFTCIHKYYTIDEWKKNDLMMMMIITMMKLFPAASSGTAEADFERLTEILNTIKDLKFICLDVANGYSQHFVEYVRKVRAAFPTHTIIVGIGPGSVCTTRIKTGVGYPQLSAVIECADAAHGLKGHIISVTFGAGADFVMAGGMFAGHDQCGGDVVTTADGRKVKLFYGMSSSTAMQKHSGGIAEYRSSEGKTVEVEYRGDVGATVKDILGGLRSACTYVGAAHLRELPRRATFIRCCRQVNDTFS
ncbi:hypothetical protein SFRURICE_021548 [Spodoptera frugiperda]|nr:hypothetical protein SFRURICE_021548 [Spodoptera frugiperda]